MLALRLPTQLPLYLQDVVFKSAVTFLESRAVRRLTTQNKILNYKRFTQSEVMKRDTTEVQNIKKCMRILQTMFLMHGINFSIGKKTRVVSILLSVFYETNAWLYFYITYLTDDMSKTRNQTRMIINFIFHTLEFAQRLYLFKVDRKLIKLMSRFLKLYFEIDTTYTTRNLSLILIAATFINTVLKILIYACMCQIIVNDPSFNNLKILNTEITYPMISVYITYFCVVWKTTTPCIAVYFYGMCCLLKSTFKKTQKLTLQYGYATEPCISIYNKTLKVTTELNDIFQLLFYITFTISLGSIFYGAFNIMGNKNIINITYRFFSLSLYLITFLTICLSSSSLLDSSKNTKRVFFNVGNTIRMKKYITEVDDEFLGFKILDSVIIDKSFILSSFGALLTYGVMIATFNQTK